jgi:hypothetical protein
LAFGSCPFAVTTALFNIIVKGDGTTAPFSIPAGQVLVITDLTVYANSKTPGDIVQIQVIAGTAGSSARPIFIDNVTAGASGGVGLSATFPTGIVVKSGTSLCPVAIDAGVNDFAGGTLRGFLTKDK